MMRLVFTALGGFALVACASGPQISDAEREINAIANESSASAPFPILGPLPSRADVIGEGIPQSTATELREASAVLVRLGQSSTVPRPSLSTEDTVVELKALIDQLRANPNPAPPVVDVQALGFPTPPPLD